jgi:NADP-dependent 3-hydroxy acid dehydrogenase YdfG
MCAGYVIFGASGGIGSALAARLVKQGGAVLLCGRSEDKLKALADKIGGGTPFVADALDGDAAEEAVKKMEGDHGEVSGVANCIGSLVLKSLHTTSADEVCQRSAHTLLQPHRCVAHVCHTHCNTQWHLC